MLSRIIKSLFAKFSKSEQMAPEVVVKTEECINRSCTRIRRMTPKQISQLKNLTPGRVLTLSNELSGPDQYESFSSSVSARCVMLYGAGRCSVRKVGQNKLIVWFREAE